VPGIDYRHCFCAKGSSTSAGMPGRNGMSFGCARSVSTTRALQLVYDSAFDALLACLDRRNRLDEAITAMAAHSEFTPVVRRLSCMRGIATLTAFGLAGEIGDWSQLTGRSVGAHLGLVPAEYSSGATRTQGAVTKTGNGHARRLLVEAAGITGLGTAPVRTRA